jgi:hypothetical protein
MSGGLGAPSLPSTVVDPKGVRLGSPPLLEMPGDAPGPARRMAEHLGNVVRAATSAGAGQPWVTALTCGRRPGHRACPGHIEVLRSDLPASIAWRCTSCGDEGVISGWGDAYCDLRGGRSVVSSGVLRLVVPAEVAATLRALSLLDTDCERVVFRAAVSEEGVVLAGSEEDLDALIDFIAADANHENDRRRQKHLDDAFAVISDAFVEAQRS